jgi:hypothetical protein
MYIRLQLNIDEYFCCGKKNTGKNGREIRATAGRYELEISITLSTARQKTSHKR